MNEEMDRIEHHVLPIMFQNIRSVGANAQASIIRTNIQTSAMLKLLYEGFEIEVDSSVSRRMTAEEVAEKYEDYCQQSAAVHAVIRAFQAFGRAHLQKEAAEKEEQPDENAEGGDI